MRLYITSYKKIAEASTFGAGIAKKASYAQIKPIWFKRLLGAVLAPGAPRAAVLIPATFQLAVFFLMWEHRPAQPEA